MKISIAIFTCLVLLILLGMTIIKSFLFLEENLSCSWKKSLFFLESFSERMNPVQDKEGYCSDICIYIQRSLSYRVWFGLCGLGNRGLTTLDSVISGVKKAIFSDKVTGIKYQIVPEDDILYLFPWDQRMASHPPTRGNFPLWCLFDNALGLMWPWRKYLSRAVFSLCHAVINGNLVFSRRCCNIRPSNSFSLWRTITREPLPSSMEAAKWE